MKSLALVISLTAFIFTNEAWALSCAPNTTEKALSNELIIQGKVEQGKLCDYLGLCPEDYIRFKVTRVFKGKAQKIIHLKISPKNHPLHFQFPPHTDEWLLYLSKSEKDKKYWISGCTKKLSPKDFANRESRSSLTWEHTSELVYQTYKLHLPQHEALESFLDLDPKNPWAYIYTAEWHLSEENYDDAEDAFHAALKLVDTEISAWAKISQKAKVRIERGLEKLKGLPTHRSINESDKN